jgi:hypothetical protein
MRVIWVMLFAVLVSRQDVAAQKVSKERLNKIVSDFAKDGFSLENMYAPDFSSPHPNLSSRYIPCYQGKTVIVAAVMGFKPASLLFKVMLKGKEAPRTHELENISTNGENYRALKFGPKYTTANKNCVNIVLYDKAAIDKPIYTLVFTKANK